MIILPVYDCCGDAILFLDGTLANSNFPYDLYWLCPKCGKTWNEWAYRLEDNTPPFDSTKVAQLTQTPDRENIVSFVRRLVKLAATNNE